VAESATGYEIISATVGNRVAFDVGTNSRTDKPEAKNESISDGEAQ
jgi:hypothetical protein